MEKLYVMPDIYCCVIFPEGILCSTQDKNLEDPEESELMGW